jgi:hypothetical protein
MFRWIAERVVALAQHDARSSPWKFFCLKYVYNFDAVLLEYYTPRPERCCQGGYQASREGRRGEGGAQLGQQIVYRHRPSPVTRSTEAQEVNDLGSCNSTPLLTNPVRTPCAGGGQDRGRVPPDKNALLARQVCALARAGRASRRVGRPGDGRQGADDKVTAGRHGGGVAYCAEEVGHGGGLVWRPA